MVYVNLIEIEVNGTQDPSDMILNIAFDLGTVASKDVDFVTRTTNLQHPFMIHQMIVPKRVIHPDGRPYGAAYVHTHIDGTGLPLSNDSFDILCSMIDRRLEGAGVFHVSKTYYHIPKPINDPKPDQALHSSPAPGGGNDGGLSSGSDFDIPH